MESIKRSLDAVYFNNLYHQNNDPWNLEESEYEKEKYAQTIDILPEKSYNKVFEIGCANGVLTQMLLQKCKQILAVDASSIAVKNAQKRLKAFSGVTIKEMVIPKDFPNKKKFDLIILSEVGYFLVMEDLIETRTKMIDALLPKGQLLLVHWTPVVAEFPLTGDQVHETFLSVAGEHSNCPITHTSQRVEPQYRMDLFTKK